MRRWRDSPLTGSIRTAAGTAADSAQRTATASCRRLPLLSVCDGDTSVHVRLVGCLRAAYRRGFMERTAKHPSAPPRHQPSHAGKEETSSRLRKEGRRREEKFVGTHAARFPLHPGPLTNCVSHDGDLYCGCDINTLCNSFARAGVVCARRKERGSCAVTKVAAA